MIVLGTLWLMACTPLPPAASANDVASPPAPIYLALGDSLAYGMQIGKLKQQLALGPLDPARFDSGYVDLLAAQLRTRNPNWHAINLGCPGETSASFIDGPCAYATNGKPFGSTPLPLHQAYTGAQLEAALAVLRQQRDQVRLISFDLGINDLRGVEAACTEHGDAVRFEACMRAHWPNAEAQISAHLEQILTALRQAAPHATLLVVTYYDWQAGGKYATSPPVQALDRAIVAAAARVGARTIDTYALFNGTTAPDDALAAHQRLCALTLYCGSTHDLHPSDAGYALIAAQLAAALPPDL